MPNVIAGPKVWFVPTNDRPRHAKADVGARLRAVRAALGVHQKVMAQALNVSPQAWSGWENGRDLADPLVMARAALRYGFTTDWIFLGRLTLLPGELTAGRVRMRGHPASGRHSMSQALEDLGGCPASAPPLTLSQSRALAALLAQARRITGITGQGQMAVLLDRPHRVHETTMRELVQRDLLWEVRCLRAGRGRRPDMRLRWRFTAAGIRVANSACPAAEAATGGRA